MRTERPESKPAGSATSQPTAKPRAVPETDQATRAEDSRFRDLDLAPGPPVHPEPVPSRSPRVPLARVRPAPPPERALILPGRAGAAPAAPREAVRPPAGTADRPLTVSQLCARIKGLIETGLPLATVSGEVSNCNYHTTGNVYFTLKDAQSQIRCVLWHDHREGVRFQIEDGQKLLVAGKVSIFARASNYQLYVDRAVPVGVGALQIQFEQLKRRLAAEGLFDDARKRPIPGLPRRVGLVTSTAGAAIKDFVNVATRRFPGICLLIVPSPVQGRGAAEQVAAAVDRLNRHARSAAPGDACDVIVLTRGGGSIEDLWTFNEEIVARAIAHSRLPVVSGIGHDVDVTIADYVADVRALTPSEAAERVVPDGRRLLGRLDDIRDRLRLAVTRSVERTRSDIERSEHRLERASPRGRLREWGQALDAVERGLRASVELALKEARARIDALDRRLHAATPAHRVAAARHYAAALAERLPVAIKRDLASRRAGVHALAGKLDSLSPLRVLERGYSLTQRLVDAGPAAVLRDAADAVPGDRVRTRLARGSITSRVEEIHSDPGPDAPPAT